MKGLTLSLIIFLLVSNCLAAENGTITKFYDPGRVQIDNKYDIILANVNYDLGWREIKEETRDLNRQYGGKSVKIDIKSYEFGRKITDKIGVGYIYFDGKCLNDEIGSKILKT